jgi:ribonuclease J
MHVVIHRGCNEIGGTCIQLSTENNSILLDLGLPLSKGTIEFDVATLRPDAVLISHPHQDHYGLIDHLDPDVPVYMGELGKNLIDATRILIGKQLHSNHFRYFKSWQAFVIGDFTITPYLVDHSAVDAYGFLIEADDKRIFYSGDFRAHGRKSVLFEKIVRHPPENIDLLFMEGTMIHRRNKDFPTEDHVEMKIFETIKDQDNITFIISSSQNIDRIVSAYRACKRARKTLVIDIYTAWILEQLKLISDHIPAMEWELVKVYATHNQDKKLTEHPDFFGDFRKRVYKYRVKKEEIQSSPADYLFWGKMSHYKIIDLYREKKRVNVIYSQWLGYLSNPESNHYGADAMGSYQNDPRVNFVYAHTSGHATVKDLQRFVAALKPKVLVPVHTEDKNGFHNIYSYVQVQNDGMRFDINQLINKFGGSMDLLNKIEEVWADGAERKASDWSRKLNKARPMIVNAKAKFHEWYPLKMYLSFTSATKSCIKFSIRYLGQEVATLSVDDNGADVNLDIGNKTAENNSKYFDVNLQGRYFWKSSEARLFRKHFQDLDLKKYQDKVKSEEHHIESEFIQHMKDPTCKKFNGTMRGIKPVMLEGFPFQFPLPISGNTGVPKSGKGNIDILARRGTGKGTKISIWELKRPNRTDHAIEQAYIYAVTLLKMLRAPETGDIWYQDIIGFNSKIPKKMTVESVVAVSIANTKNRHKFEEKFKTFKKNNRLSIGNDTINLHIAHYKKDTLSIEFVNI